MTSVQEDRVQDLVRLMSDKVGQVSVKGGISRRNGPARDLLARGLEHQDARGPHLAKYVGVLFGIIEVAWGCKGAVQRTDACEEPASDRFGAGSREWFDEVRHER